MRVQLTQEIDVAWLWAEVLRPVLWLFSIIMYVSQVLYPFVMLPLSTYMMLSVPVVLIGLVFIGTQHLLAKYDFNLGFLWVWCVSLGLMYWF
ncbi:MAG: hypothetical protein RLZZ422_1488 [Pseudomonadota bacterium]|jgi:hypothetical protein